MCRSWLLLSLLLCGALWTTTAAPFDPETSASASDTASSISSPYPPLTQMATSEFTVDREGLWTDTEVPLSEASIRAIQEATPATPQDEQDMATTTVVYTVPTTNVHVMETNAVEENENENEAEVAQDGIESETDEQTPITLDDAESNESETSATEDEIDIAAGSHGRMILIPHSSHLDMTPLINRLTRIISILKQHSSLDRITLKLEIEPMIPRTRRAPVYPSPPRARARTRARLDLVRSPSRPRPISIRLIPSRSEIRTRTMLARCRMLLRQALNKLKKIKVRRTHHRKSPMTRLAHWLRRLGIGHVRGVTVLHGTNFTHTDDSTRRISHGNIEVEAEQNSTARVFAPTIALRMHRGSLLVVNRGVIVIVNRSANNTVSVTSPPPSPSPRLGMYRRFMIPSSRAHVEVSASVNAAPATSTPE